MKKKSHDYHIVSPSPWPILLSTTLLLIAVGLVSFIHRWFYGKFVLSLGVFLFFLTLYMWCKDVIQEAIRDKAHTEIVKNGLRFAMLLLIISELMMFSAFFISFIKSWLEPGYSLDNFFPMKRLTWPPEGILPLDPWSIPFLNTVILLLSGCTVTWAHYCIKYNDMKGMQRMLGFTILLGITFSFFQGIEYLHSDFSLKPSELSTIYPSNFYITTGFHGIHVILGTIFLIICWFRAKNGQLSSKEHVGFECAVWYWHFVDVLWLFLFTFVYWLSS